jgi:CheY-like chemotaxis protein
VLGNVRQCAEIMDDMFLALLDLSRLDAQVVAPRIERFPIAAILSRLKVEFAPQAKAKGLQLRVARCSAWIESDMSLVEQILRNLIANAIRYTETGMILVGCRRTGTALRLAVYDTGIGISPSQQKSVFEEFCQVGNAGRDRTKGLGLGLAIVQRLGRLLSTPITLISALGQGSMFAVDVPRVEGQQQSLAESSAPGTPTPVSSDTLAGKLIVVVDDEAAILDGMRILLEQWGCTVVTALSGDDALATLSSIGQVPDVLICDYRLRLHESGIEVIEQLRSEFNQDIPALMVTGEIAPERLQATLAYDLVVLHKPLNSNALRHALIRLMREYTDGVPR